VDRANPVRRVGEARKRDATRFVSYYVQPRERLRRTEAQPEAEPAPAHGLDLSLKARCPLNVMTCRSGRYRFSSHG
jgi:hypothetical protein